MSADALAILAAFMFALAAVLQQREAVTAGGGGMSAAFFLALIRKPIWLLGTAALIGGYILQGAALGKGRLVIIQPLLVTTVVFALPLGVLLTHQVVTRRDWAAAAGVVAALAAFIVIGDPAPGLDDAPGWEWAVSLVIVSVLAALVVLFGRHLRSPRRAAALGSAAGMLFGLSACLAKPVVEELGDDGLAAVLGDWLTWAMIGTGAAALPHPAGGARDGPAGAGRRHDVAGQPGRGLDHRHRRPQEGLAGGFARKTLAVAALVAAGLCAIVLAEHEQPGPAAAPDAAARPVGASGLSPPD